MARPHGVVLPGDRRTEERHDPVAHDLVHRAAVLLDGLAHVLEDRIEELARFLGIAVGDELHRALEVREQDGHELALAFQRGGAARTGPAAGIGRCRAAAATGCPHSGQNLAAGGRTVPQTTHVADEEIAGMVRFVRSRNAGPLPRFQVCGRFCPEVRPRHRARSRSERQP